MTATEFHSDLLIPARSRQRPVAGLSSGMVWVDLDARGQLVRFEAMPPQLLEQTGLRELVRPIGFRSFVRWAGCFLKLQPAEPFWTWLATSDNRAAWTGTWPGTSRPLRVEAASLQGTRHRFCAAGSMG